MFLWLNGSKPLLASFQNHVESFPRGVKAVIAAHTNSCDFGMKCPIIACAEPACPDTFDLFEYLACLVEEKSLWSFFPSPDKQRSVCASVCEIKHGSTLQEKKKKAIVTDKEGKRW